MLLGSTAESLQSIAPPCTKIRGRFRPIGEVESETTCQQPGGNDTPALQCQFTFAAQEEGPNLQHPLARRKTERNAPGRAQVTHEFGIGQWVRRRHVDWPIELFVFNQ